MRIDSCLMSAKSMVKVSVFYDSKYGNTRLAAEKIVESLKSNGVKADLAYVKDVKPGEAVCSDVIVLGAPNHMAQPSKTMKRFIEYLAAADQKATQFAVFGTYAGRARPVDRAVKKLEAMVQAKMPTLKPVLTGLSVRVNGVRGPVMDGELSKCLEFGKEIATRLGK